MAKGVVEALLCFALGTYTSTYTKRGVLLMGQVTIYLDDDTEAKARDAAATKGVSLSKWIAERIERGTRAEWPAFVRELEGAWADLPSAAELRKRQGRDVRRGRL